jgi:CDP-diacylglycerol--serine O-phosphatidyltransferase
VLVYTLFIAFMMVSTIPTYSGKLLGERVGREWVLPIFVIAVAVVAMLFTYPYQTLTAITLIYLAFIPVSWRNFQEKIAQGEAAEPAAVSESVAAEPVASGGPAQSHPGDEPPKTTGRIFTLRTPDQPK